MKRPLLFLLFGLIAFAAEAQYQLKGKVVDARTEQPLEFVAVFINTTTHGTTTNKQGEFVLQLAALNQEVVVSLVGYEPLVFVADADKLASAVLFRLREKEYNLQEVEITARHDALWYKNLEVFKENFLGRSNLGRKCSILNEKALIIQYDSEKRELLVRSKEPLQILNPELGYKIEYHLIEFRYLPRQRYISFIGYPRYTALKGKPAQQQKWEQNREKAYKGSAMHFVRSLRAQQLEEQHFYLRRLHRLPNPERPTDEAIAAARAALRAREGKLALHPNDSLNKLIEKSYLPKFIEVLDTTRVPYADYLILRDNHYWIAANQLFQVVYTAEKEEVAYVRAYPQNRSPKPGYQTSVLCLLQENVLLEENGAFFKPLDVLLEGYWSWEKFGDLLPLDYQPKQE